EEGPALNARAEGDFLEKIAELEPSARALLAKAAEAGGLTARGWTRTLRLARTIADLEGSGAVRRLHVAEAVIYRRAGQGVDEQAHHEAELAKWVGKIGATTWPVAAKVRVGGVAGEILAEAREIEADL